MSDFSMELNEDQMTHADWVHGFAEQSMRPIAAEWDEREETPWAVHPRGREDRHLLPRLHDERHQRHDGSVVDDRDLEELAWGDAGLSMALMGTSLGVAAIVANGTPSSRWSGCRGASGHPTTSSSRPLGSRSLTQEATSHRCAREPSTTRRTTSGSSTARRPGSRTAASRTCTSSLPRSTPSSAARGQASFIVPEGTPGHSPWVRSSRRWASARATPPRSSSRTVESRVPACSAAKRSSTRSSLACARANAPSQAAMATFEATRPAIGAQALGIARAAYEYSLDYAKERKQFGRAIIENQAIAFKLADMKTRIDASRLLVWRAAWMAATQHTIYERRGLDVQALRERDRRHGDRRGDSDSWWLRLRSGVPRRTVAPRLEDLHDLRRYERNSASHCRSRDLWRSNQVAQSQKVKGSRTLGELFDAPQQLLRDDLTPFSRPTRH